MVNVKDYKDHIIVNSNFYLRSKVSCEIVDGSLRLLSDGEKIITRAFQEFTVNEQSYDSIEGLKTAIDTLVNKFANEDQRKENVRTLINAGIGDPNIDNIQLGVLFNLISGRILIYERAGINLILDWIDQELVSNANGMQTFLNVTVEPGELTNNLALPVHVVIKSILV